MRCAKVMLATAAVAFFGGRALSLLGAALVPFKPAEVYYLALTSEDQRPTVYVADDRGFGRRAGEEDLKGRQEVLWARHVNVGSGLTLLKVRRQPGPAWGRTEFLYFMEGVDGIKAPPRDRRKVRLRLDPARPGDKTVEEWLWVDVAEH